MTQTSTPKLATICTECKATSSTACYEDVSTGLYDNGRDLYRATVCLTCCNHNHA